jgi:hypothetical protein
MQRYKVLNTTGIVSVGLFLLTAAMSVSGYDRSDKTSSTIFSADRPNPAS